MARNLRTTTSLAKLTSEYCTNNNLVCGKVDRDKNFSCSKFPSTIGASREGILFAYCGATHRDEKAWHMEK